MFGSSSSKLEDPMSYFVEEFDEYADLEYSKLNEEDENGNTPLIFAASQGREDLASALIDQVCFKELISLTHLQGAYVNHQNNNGETALYWAASEGNVAIAEYLVENGANLNICTLDGTSPAHIAAANGHVAMLALLFKNGGFMNVQDNERDSVLHYAVREGQMKVVEFLVKECKVDINLQNEDQESALDLALCLCDSAMIGENYAPIAQLLSQSSAKQEESVSGIFKFGHKGGNSTFLVFKFT